MGRIVVVGGGASGMMAAGVAAYAGAQVMLLEKNATLGKKLLITGKGRCNLTNATDVEETVARFGPEGRFLYSALNVFPPMATQTFFQERGLGLIVERGQRVFPASGEAGDVVAILETYMRKAGVAVRPSTPVEAILIAEGELDGEASPKVTGVRLKNGQSIEADVVILATGGASYPGTGSTGGGYGMAEKVGHTIQPILPALVPLRVREPWVRGVAGLSLRNVRARLCDGDKLLGSEFGEMLITHFGVSGPIILTLSRFVSPYTSAGRSLRLAIDLKPALNGERLDERVQRDFDKYKRKAIKNALGDLLPKSLIPVVIAESGISPEEAVHQITREERSRLVGTLKALPLTVTGTLPLSAAIVTAGGVTLSEVDPKTMESRLVGGLCFAGEVLNLAADTGGFNLQAAFATGYVAGNHGARMATRSC